jgi:hypothetical protein
MSRTTAALLFGVAFVSLTAIGAAIVFTGKPDTPIADAVQRPERPEVPAQSSEPPDVEPPTTAAALAPVSPLAGAWQAASSKNIYDAVVVGRRVEFQVRDPETFGKHWQHGEWRFALMPNGANEFFVEDRIRPNPGVGFRYANGPAPASCNFIYSELNGEKLTATLTDANTLIVNMVNVAHTTHHFDLKGGVIAGCRKLDTAPTTPITSTLVRIRD